MMRRVGVVIVSAALALAGCHKKPADDPAASATNATTAETEPSAATATPTATPSSSADAPAPVGTYDTGKAPVSTVKLGTFPYLSLPAGYEATGAETLDLARFPVWVGDHFVWVESKVYQSQIYHADGKTCSKYEVQRNIEDEITQAGGKKIAAAQLPSNMREKLNPDAQQVDKGLGDIISNPAVTYLIHRADKDIWVHFSSSTNYGHWAVIETKAFAPSAKLLPASLLKDSIDKTGKATIAVNFAVDKATILPSSQPQIVEVTKLLGGNQMKLAVEGHTDNSGTPAHNQTLSEARARSVVAALVEAGVSAGRLTARGFGATRPVDSNATEAGRAANRRVELVRV